MLFSRKYVVSRFKGILILSLFNASLAHADSKQWEIGEAYVSLAARTQEEAREEAKQRAIKEAIEKVAGVHIRSELIVQADMESQQILEHINSLSYAHCIGHEILEEKPVIDAKSNQTSYYVRVRARIAIDKEKGDPGFCIKANLNRTVFQEMDEMSIQVRPTLDCYVTIFNILPGGKASVIFPNRYHPSGLVRKGEVFIFPGQEDLERGINLRAMVLTGSNRSFERMLIIATLDDEDLIESDFAEAIYGQFNEKETSLEDLVFKKLIRIDPARRTTAVVPFEVRSKLR